MNHYPIANYKLNQIKNEGYMILDLSLILLDQGMIVKIKSLCDVEAKRKKLKKLPNSQTFNLTKIDLVSKDFEIKKPLDPINIKNYKNTKYYEIIDGRHRYVLSLSNGYSHIPVYILS